jgi:hypothetical protein
MVYFLTAFNDVYQIEVPGQGSVSKACAFPGKILMFEL